MMRHTGFRESHVLCFPAVRGFAACFERRIVRLYCFFLSIPLPLRVAMDTYSTVRALLKACCLAVEAPSTLTGTIPNPSIGDGFNWAL